MSTILVGQTMSTGEPQPRVSVHCYAIATTMVGSNDMLSARFGEGDT